MNLSPRFPAARTPGPWWPRRGRALFALALGLLLAACGSMDKDPTAKWDADRIYNEAHDELDGSNWSKARELLEKLESRFPFGRFAQQAQIEIAYCYYKETETAEALSAIDRFLKLNPNHPLADYAYYLRGLVNFIEPPALLGRFIDYQVSERDPKALRDSFEAFKELVTRYPGSRYATDATQRMRFLVDALAGHELHVADYYYRRGAYLAAATRAQGVVRQYQGSLEVEPALVIMMRSYAALGMEDLRADTERVLRANYPADAALARTGAH